MTDAGALARRTPGDDRLRGLAPDNGRGVRAAVRGLLKPLAALHPDFWHKGYATEALRRMIGYAFAELAKSVLAAVNDGPIRSRIGCYSASGSRGSAECRFPATAFAPVRWRGRAGAIRCQDREIDGSDSTTLRSSSA